MKRIFFSCSLLIIAITLNSQVIPEWVNIFPGPDTMEIGGDIAVSDSGFVYVTGTNFRTIKYTSSGNQVWQRSYNGYANVLAIDHEGNIIVAGAVENGENGYDYGVIKFDNEGNQQWIATYQGLSAGNDEIKDMAIDNQGYIYVTGAITAEWGDTWQDYGTLKISPSGDIIWARKFGDSGMFYDIAMGIAVSDSGFVYVTGYSDGDVQGGRLNYCTIKYAPNGDTLWVRHYNGTGNDDDIPFDIALDQEDNVIVTGYSWGFYYNDYATVKYNAAGTQLWVARYNGPVNSHDKAKKLVVDGNGNIYVTGSSGGKDVTYDYTTIKYSPSGNELWVARYTGQGKNDYANDIALDNNGNIYVTGYSEDAGHVDLATVKYNNDGVEQWSSRYRGENYKYNGNAITTDKAGNVYVTGNTTFWGHLGSEMVTLKYGASTGMEEYPATNNINIFPNPVTTSLYISLPSDINYIEVEIFDAMGRSVLKTKTKQEIDVSNLSRGLYCIRVQINGYRLSRIFVKQ